MLTPSKLTRKYRPRILRHLNDIKDLFEAGPFKMEPVYEDNSDGICWRLEGADVHMDEEDEDAGFTITVSIIDGSQFGGSKTDMSFRMEVIGNGGQIIANFAPYNYTERCWVSRADEKAVLERWLEFQEGSEPTAVTESVRDFMGDLAVAKGTNKR